MSNPTSSDEAREVRGVGANSTKADDLSASEAEKKEVENIMADLIAPRVKYAAVKLAAAKSAGSMMRTDDTQGTTVDTESPNMPLGLKSGTRWKKVERVGAPAAQEMPSRQNGGYWDWDTATWYAPGQWENP